MVSVKWKRIHGYGADFQRMMRLRGKFGDSWDISGDLWDIFGDSWDWRMISGDFWEVEMRGIKISIIIFRQWFAVGIV